MFSSEIKSGVNYFIGAAIGIFPVSVLKSCIIDLVGEFGKSVDEGLFFLNENNEEQGSEFRLAICKMRDEDLDFIGHG